jgi:HAE1 family hydrophobic/amphiphilic exporter-1
MPDFAIRNPYFIVVICLIIGVVGITALVRMPVDMFPNINIPVVVVATFYSGMPPEQIEVDITGRFERFFTLGSGIEHIESRSLPGVSLIKVYFQPGANADSAVTMISNLAMANLRRLPPGTLPPVVLKFDASSLPVCLISLKGEGLSETVLRDAAQYAVRNQVANVPGASVPQPFGGRYRQIMIYLDPLKLDAHRLSAMDVVRAVNDSNLILPAGDVPIGNIDYNIYTNSQLRNIAEINEMPLKTLGPATIRVADVGTAQDAQQIQYNVVRVDGQPSVYLPVLKQGGDTNTIAVVDGIKSAVTQLVDVPANLAARVVFDQSLFVKGAIQTLLSDGALGLFLTSVLILMFLGNVRATIAVLLSVPLAALATMIALWAGGSSVNSMILGGLALAFTRLIYNSIVVLENIFRHIENGSPPLQAAERGGGEMGLPVLASTLTTVVVFFPVTFLYGVSRFLFSALALAVVLSLFASYGIAMTGIPLFCSRMLQRLHASGEPRNGRFRRGFNRAFGKAVAVYERVLRQALRYPAAIIAFSLVVSAASLLVYPHLGVSFFPRTDSGQFLINVKAPSGTRLEVTEEQVKQVEDIVRDVVDPKDLGIIVSNIGVTPGFSAIYTSNSAQHTGFIQVGLNENHKVSSFNYMNQVRRRVETQMPNLTTYFQTGGLVDSVLNMGLPAPIDIQVSGSNLEADYDVARELVDKIRQIDGISDVFTPQDLDYPALQLDINRIHASQLGLNQREIVQNVITALTSNQMIAPSYWVDPVTGNDYLLTAQYPEGRVRTLEDLKSIPLRAPNKISPTPLDSVSSIRRIQSPTEVDHYQLRKVIDIYVAPSGEDLGRVAKAVDEIIGGAHLPEGVRVDLRGMVQGMRESFKSFAFGLSLAVVLLYLILVAPFRSVRDPLLILLSVPPGLAGVIVTLYLTGTTMNVQSLMGVVMMVGIVVSNGILIVEFANRLRDGGRPAGEAIIEASLIRMRPMLMSSLATIVGLFPMALSLGTGSEAYAPLARAIIGGLVASLAFTVFIVPAAYLLSYRKRAQATAQMGA